MAAGSLKIRSKTGLTPSRFIRVSLTSKTMTGRSDMADLSVRTGVRARLFCRTLRAVPLGRRHPKVDLRVESLRWSRLVLDGEAQPSEHRYGSGLPALEIAGCEALTGGELVGGAQDCLRRVPALLPHQVVRCGGSKTVFRIELLGSELVVLLYRAQHVVTAHVCPQPGERICHRVLPRSSRRGTPVVAGGWSFPRRYGRCRARASPESGTAGGI